MRSGVCVEGVRLARGAMAAPRSERGAGFSGRIGTDVADRRPLVRAGFFRFFSRLAGPCDEIVFQCAGLSFTNAAACGRGPGFNHAFRIAGNKRMPCGQGTPFGEAAVGAVGRKPVQFGHHCRCQGDAVLHFSVAVRVVRAATVGDIQQAAGDGRIVNFVRVFVTQLMQAATATAITQGFPLSGGHLLEQGGFPERSGG